MEKVDRRDDRLVKRSVKANAQKSPDRNPKYSNRVDSVEKEEKVEKLDRGDDLPRNRSVKDTVQRSLDNNLKYVNQNRQGGEGGQQRQGEEGGQS